MGVSAGGFGIAVGINAAIFAVITLAFSIWRRLPFTEKFYASKLFKNDVQPGHTRPPPISTKFGSWILSTFHLSEDQVIACAGLDALCFIKLVRMGWELFLIISLIVCSIILPINITGGFIDDLKAGRASDGRSAFTFWLNSTNEATDPEDELKPVKPPPIYEEGLPDPPAGLVWWKYLPDVPPLPTPEQYYNDTMYANYSWRYDPNYVTVEYTFTNLDKLTMANIKPRSRRLIAHAVIMWLITIISMWKFWNYCKLALRLRIYHLLNSTVGAETHTVVVTDVPGVARGTIVDRLPAPLLKLVPQKAGKAIISQSSAIKNKLQDTTAKLGSQSSSAGIEALESTGKDIWSEWNPPNRWEEAHQEIKNTGTATSMIAKVFKDAHGENEVAEVISVYVTSRLDSLHSEYENIKDAAINAIDGAITRHQKGKKMKPRMKTVIGPKYGTWGRNKYDIKPVKVNLYEFMKDRMEYLREEIYSSQKESLKMVEPTAFVTFRSRRGQVVASENLLCEDLETWLCQAAPRPDEIIWPNLGLRKWERSLRSLIMNICFVLLAVFYMIPVTAVQALISTPSLVSWIEDIPIAGAMLVGIIPGLALLIFLQLLPVILTAMMKFTGRFSVSSVDFGVITRFFIFQYLLTFLGTFITGSLANQFKQFIEDPGSIIDVLGTSAPQTGIFFTNLLLIEGLIGEPMGLLNVVSLAIFWIKTIIASTERSKERAIPVETTQYGKEIPFSTIAILLGLSFSILFPIMAPAVVVYFTAVYIARKYILCYREITPYQSGGLFWRSIFWQTIAGLISAQVILIAVLAIKESIPGPLIVLPLPFLTLIFAFVTRNRFFPSMKILSLIAAAARDKENPENDAKEIQNAHDSYLPSSFSFEENEHKIIVQQLEVLRDAQEKNDYSSILSLDTGCMNHNKSIEVGLPVDDSSFHSTE